MPVTNSSYSVLSQGHPREIQEHPKALGFAKTEVLTLAPEAGAHSPNTHTHVRTVLLHFPLTN